MAANWNLSVDLRGSGQSLAQTLRQNTTHARALGRAARTAQRDLNTLGEAAQNTGRHVKQLGRDAKVGARSIRSLGAAARTTKRDLTSMGGSAHTSAVRLGRLGTKASAAARDLRKLARAAAAADAELQALSDSVTVTAHLDDQTASGLATVDATLAALQAREPVALSVTLDDDTSAGAAEVRAVVQDLQALSPVQLRATLDDDTGTGVAAVRAAVQDLQALSTSRLSATLDDDTTPGLVAVTDAVRELQALSPVQLRTTLDDDTSPGLVAVTDAVRELQALSPVQLRTTLDDDTTATIAAVTAAVQDLQALSPVTLSVTLDDDTSGGLASVTTAVQGIQALSPIQVTASLDDDTAAGIAAVQTGLQGLHALSPVSVRATLDDDTAAGIAAVRTALQGLQGLSPVTLTANFDGDPAQIAAAAAAIGDVRDRADAAATALTQLTTHAAASAVAMNAAQNAAQDLARALRTLRGRAAATAAAMDDLAARAQAAVGGLRGLNNQARTADGRLDTLSGRTRTLTGDLDDLHRRLGRVGTGLGGLRGNLTTTGGAAGDTGDNMKSLIVLAVGLATALLPVAAATVPIAVGLGAAGVAVGAFGAAIGAQIKHLTEAAEAQTEYEDAVAEHGVISKEATEADVARQRVLAKMPDATREASAAWGVLTDQYTAWSDASAKDTMPVLTKSMGVMGAMLPRLTPMVQGASGQLDRLVTVIGGAVVSPGFDAFMVKFADFAADSLGKATTGLVRFSRALDTGAVNSNVNEFMEYARANGPAVADTLGNLADALLNLVLAGGEMGVSMLQVVNVLAQLVAAVPPDALATMMQLYMAFKLVTLGAAALGAVTGGAAAANLAAFIRSARFGGVGAAITGVAQRMSLLAKSALGLGVLAVAAMGINKLAEKARGAPPDVDRLSTSLKQLALTGKMAGELQKTFGGLDGITDKLKKLREESTKAAEASKGAFGFRIPILDDIGDWFGDKANDLAKGSDSLKALQDDFKGLDQAMAGLVGSGRQQEAAAGFDLVAQAGKRAGWSTEQINSLLPSYTAALQNLKTEQDLAAAGMGVFGAQAQATQAKLDGQKASADGLRQSLVALAETNRAALGGMIGFEAAIDAAAKAAKENAGALRMVGGELDLNSPKAQAAATALQGLGDKTNAAAVAARESGRSWEYVNNIYDRGTEALVKSAMQMGLNGTQARELAASILQIPPDHVTQIRMMREDAIAGLNQVQAAIKATPGAKSVTVSALTSSAVVALERLGFKVKTMPDGTVTVTVPTGGALSAVRAIQNAVNNLHGKDVVNNVYTYSRFVNVGAPPKNPNPWMVNARGSVTDYYAHGGIRPGGDVQHFAGGGTTSGDAPNRHVAQIAPAGSWRVWGEPETAGEGYVPFRADARPRSRAITEEIVRRLGGDPAGIQWHAVGNVTDWRYDPSTGSLYSASDAGSAGNKTKKVTVKTKDKKGKVTTSTKEVNYFDLATVEKQIKSTAKATRGWNNDLATVADRVGTDVADALAAMGKDGILLTQKMARGSTKYINEMAASLRGLAETARVSLTDYTRQLGKATTADSKFAADLATLAGRGYGDLAKQLAAQGDAAAMGLAAAAVKDSKKAASANSAARTANRALTNDEVADLVAIISAVTGPKVGLHAVAESTGLGEDTIVEIATKASAQIKAALGSRATQFLSDLGRAQKGLSYADGGIRAGMYATSGGIVRFAEPETGGEAYIPLSPAKRASATRVLADVAGRFGKGVTDMRATRPVVVTTGGDTHVTVTAVRTPASATDIAAQVGRSVRRARRGGVLAHA